MPQCNRAARFRIQGLRSAALQRKKLNTVASYGFVIDKHLGVGFLREDHPRSLGLPTSYAPAYR